MKKLTQKGILMLVSVVTLSAALIYISVAWYTKMTSISDMTFDVAQWDYNANYVMDDMILNVFQYSTLNNQKAAPGTAGKIPVRLTAQYSDTDVHYTITVEKDSMSEEFQKRIYFYSDAAMANIVNENHPISGSITRGTSTTVYVYWKWIYEYDDLPNSYKVQGDASTIAAASKAFDAFDTLVGMDPERYAKEMNATLRVTGAQVVPERMP